MHGARGSTERAHGTSTAPPSAARSRRIPAGVSRRASTAAPAEWHRSATPRRAGTSRGHIREAQRSHRFTGLVIRCPPASPLFASWPWPRHPWRRVGSDGDDRIGAASFEEQTGGVACTTSTEVPLAPDQVFGLCAPLPFRGGLAACSGGLSSAMAWPVFLPPVLPLLEPPTAGAQVTKNTPSRRIAASCAAS